MPTRTFDPESKGWNLQRGFIVPIHENVREYRGGWGNVDDAIFATKTIREWNLTYKTGKTTDPRIGYDYAVGFHAAEVGAAGRFNWAPPELVPTPFEAPSLSSVVSGTQGARTISVGFLWKSAAGSTRLSPLGSLAVAASSLLKVDLPPYPPSITQAEIFAEEGGSGDEQSQVTLTDNDRSWTQPDAAILVATSDPPVANTATELSLVKFVLDSFEIFRGEGLAWVMRCHLEEIY